MKKKEFCRECGKECTTYIEGVGGWQSYEMLLMSFPSISGYSPTYPKFNAKGEPNMIQVYECPDRKVKKWWGIKTFEEHTKIGRKIGEFY